MNVVVCMTISWQVGMGRWCLCIAQCCCTRYLFVADYLSDTVVILTYMASWGTCVFYFHCSHLMLMLHQFHANVVLAC